MDIAPDGTFRIEDVRAGSYSLSVEARAPGSDPSVKHGTIIATGDCKFVVPDIPGGRSEEALRLPDVALKVYRHVSVPSVGDTAPDIIAQTLDGKPLSLADFRGRFVLLEFSATWCNPCRGEIPDLKEMYNRYGKDGRLVIVSLSIDNMPYAPKQFANEFSLAWPQGFVGPDGNAVNDFGVDEYGVPSMWLIGPDGKILSRPMPGENTDQLWTKTAAAVAAVLGN
jgi:peroxiredoxin